MKVNKWWRKRGREMDAGLREEKEEEVKEERGAGCDGGKWKKR